MKVATEVMFNQMSSKAGIKKFVERAVEAMVKYCKQIYKGPVEGKPSITPIDPDTLSYKDRRKALEAVNLIK